MTEKTYYYHIITTADIEEELQSKGAYPVVHQYNETCEVKCYGDDDDSHGWQELDADRRRKRRMRESELGEDSGTENTKLCTGPKGVGEFEADGSYRVRWGNGRVRRYSIGGGSKERIGADNRYVDGRVCRVGTFTEKPEDNVPGVYDGPYKLIAQHSGTRRRHWHLIYISRNKQWGFNSRLGRIIRKGTYKTTSIDCLSCLREYLYSGDGRQVVQDILGDEYLKTCQCASHSCGMDGISEWTKKMYQSECGEGGNSIHGNEGVASAKEYGRMVDATGETGDTDVRKRLRNGSKVSGQDGKILHGRKNSNDGVDSGEDCGMHSRNTSIILLLCENGAFTEAEAMEVLTRSAEGIEFICSKQYAERIKNYIHIARILVFQESIKQRFERYKAHFDKIHTVTEEMIDVGYASLTMMLEVNEIDERNFADNTFLHFTGQSGKKNNLFFKGPPTTGKTMLMNSLIECQFNYCRLTGLTPNSSFNFSGLLHCNACFMDECKLTENQFEQWKLLASRMPMSTDVKYKDRCNISGCILYTCSNYPIEIYCKVPMAKTAIDERTIQYDFRIKVKKYVIIPPQAWERLWQKYNHRL